MTVWPKECLLCHHNYYYHANARNLGCPVCGNDFFPNEIKKLLNEDNKIQILMKSYANGSNSIIETTKRILEDLKGASLPSKYLYSLIMLLDCPSCAINTDERKKDNQMIRMDIVELINMIVKNWLTLTKIQKQNIIRTLNNPHQLMVLIELLMNVDGPRYDLIDFDTGNYRLPANYSTPAGNQFLRVFFSTDYVLCNT